MHFLSSPLRKQLQKFSILSFRVSITEEILKTKTIYRLVNQNREQYDQIAINQKKQIDRIAQICLFTQIRNPDHRSFDQLQIFKRQIIQITNDIFELQKQGIKQVLNPTRYYTKVDSFIMEEDPVGLKYILHELQHPKRLKLIFRASEYDFSAYEFHKCCDDIKNTLTTIKTEENKILAGFTPLTWMSTLGFISDRNFQTFILSVTDRQKYKLKKFNMAIKCNQDTGPCFGDDDICLLDGDEIGVQLYLNFPQSFNFKQKYQKTEMLIQKIAVQTDDNYVWAEEYEVYQVIQK